MKILHVITSLRIGGAEKLLADLLPRLQQNGHKVAIYVFLGIHTPLVDQLQSSGVRVLLGRDTDSVYNPKHIKVLRKLMPEYDIVHAHNSSPQLFVALANIGLNKPIVTTEHSSDNRRRKLIFFHPLDKWMYRQYRRIICISKPCKKNLQEYLDLEITNSLCIINNGIDTQHFAKARPSLEYCHKSLHASHIIINVAGFRWEKDQPTIIRAIQLLPEDYHLLLAGDGELKNNCYQLARKLGVDGRVHFLGLRTDVDELLQASDVVVMSSHHEGLSLSNLEGMAAGKPFVASDVVGLKEIVAGYGLLFPHENHQVLASIIKKLCEDKEYAATVATRCQQRAMEFDIKNTVAAYDAIYDEIIT